MSYTLTETGKVLTETQNGVTMPADYSFATVNDYIHGIGVQFEDLQALCLGMASYIDKLKKGETTRHYGFLTLTDDAWIASVRADYPEETAGMSDDCVRDTYAHGCKYADTWDHLGDAREDYEQLADAYLDLLTRSGLDA